MEHFRSDAPVHLQQISFAANHSFITLWELITEINEFFNESLPRELRDSLTGFTDVLEKASETLDRYQDRLRQAPAELEDTYIQRLFVQNIDDRLAAADSELKDFYDFKPHQHLFTQQNRLKSCAMKAFDSIGALIKNFRLNSVHLVEVRKDILDFYIFLDQADLENIN